MPIARHKIISIFIISLASLVAIVIGILDHSAGYESSLTTFYLFPILLTTWFQGKNAGLGIAILSAVVSLIADMTSGHLYAQILTPFWNALMSAGVFITVVFLEIGFKKDYELEKKLDQMDLMTGICNMRYFIERAKIEIARALEINEPLTIAYMNLDNFKKVNDALGYERGDRLLKLVAQAMKKNVRLHDVVAKFGGDEFLMLFPATGPEEAKVAVGKIRDLLLQIFQEHADFMTSSIGVVTYHRPTVTAEEMIKKADDLMRIIKARGKNAARFEVVNQ